MSCCNFLLNNHITLVNNVYPKEPSQPAIPSSLSLLLFYANAKPQKLSKIGFYLEKRNSIDLKRGRIG